MGYIQQKPEANLLGKHTFFRFLLKKSAEEKLLSISKKMTHRPNTDDDMWVIPEIIEQDMYKIRELMPQLQTSAPSYVIDCGAHIGAFSLLCALSLKNVNVFSFEPVPENFAHLSQNVKNVSNIQPIKKAVALEEGKLMLYAPDQKEWTGRWSTNPNSNTPISVDAIHLFDFIKKLDKPVFILKLDLEGYEETLINQSSIDDWANVQVLVLETHSEKLNHNKLMESGFQLLFQPHISSARQFVYSKNLS